MAKEHIAITDNPREAASRAAKVLRNGGIVVFPTETVYGIGALATHADALARLRALKERPDSKPFQFLIADMEAAENLGAVFSPRAQRLARAFWPGPLTLVVPDGTGTIPDTDGTETFPVGDGDGKEDGEGAGGTLGVRVPDSPFMLALLRELNGALVSSSANPAGAPPPRDAEAADAFGDAVDLLIDGGMTNGTASTVVKCDGGNFEILRPGGVNADTIRAAWNGTVA